MKTKSQLLLRRFGWLVVVAAVLAVILTRPEVRAFFDKDDQPKTFEDLTPGERVYIERMIVLERAKSVAFIHREAGDAILDSLNAAWGDSSFQETLAGAPTQPERSAAVAEILRRMITVEQESLRAHPGQDRLPLPLPDSTPEPAPEEPATETDEETE